MNRRRLTLFILALILSVNLIAQEQKSTFYSEADGTIGNRTHVNAVSFGTTNTTTVFYKTLRKRFGKPRNDGYFQVYTAYNRNWSKSKIVIRIQPSIDKNLDGSMTNTVFIYVETIKKIDLLRPQSSSRNKIVNYFRRMFKSTIEYQPADKFN